MLPPHRSRKVRTISPLRQIAQHFVFCDRNLERVRIGSPSFSVGFAIFFVFTGEIGRFRIGRPNVIDIVLKVSCATFRIRQTLLYLIQPGKHDGKPSLQNDILVSQLGSFKTSCNKIVFHL